MLRDGKVPLGCKMDYSVGPPRFTLFHAEDILNDERYLSIGEVQISAVQWEREIRERSYKEALDSKGSIYVFECVFRGLGGCWLSNMEHDDLVAAVMAQITRGIRGVQGHARRMSLRVQEGMTDMIMLHAVRRSRSMTLAVKKGRKKGHLSVYEAVVEEIEAISKQAREE